MLTVRVDLRVETFHSLWTFSYMDIITYGLFTLWTICRFTDKKRFLYFSLYKANCWPKSRYPFLNYCYLVLFILGMLPLIIAYPILLMIVKFVSTFHHGTEWKKLDSFMTLFEGQIEGYLQVTLQVILYQSDSLFHQSIQDVTTKFTGIYHNSPVHVVLVSLLFDQLSGLFLIFFGQPKKKLSSLREFLFTLLNSLSSLF